MSHDGAALRNSIRRQQIAKCREMAVEAERLAVNSTGATRQSFITLAKQWSVLANEMEQDAA
jgi:hypothetical protein